MKLFVAAEPSPGETFDTVPGELVRFPVSICESMACECDRAMYGLVSNRATPAVMVRDIDIDTVTYTELLREALERAEEERAADDEWLEGYATQHIEAASFLPCDEPLTFFHMELADPEH